MTIEQILRQALARGAELQTVRLERDTDGQPLVLWRVAGVTVRYRVEGDRADYVSSSPRFAPARRRR